MTGCQQGLLQEEENKQLRASLLSSQETVRRLESELEAAKKVVKTEAEPYGRRRRDTNPWGNALHKRISESPESDNIALEQLYSFGVSDASGVPGTRPIFSFGLAGGSATKTVTIAAPAGMASQLSWAFGSASQPPREEMADKKRAKQPPKDERASMGSKHPGGD